MESASRFCEAKRRSWARCSLYPAEDLYAFLFLAFRDNVPLAATASACVVKGSETGLVELEDGSLAVSRRFAS